MIKKIRVKSILDLNDKRYAGFVEHVAVKCNTELSIQLENKNDWIVIYTAQEDVILRIDVVANFDKTGRQEDIENQRDSDYSCESHKELENYAKAFQKHYIELINDKANEIQKHLDIMQSFMKRIRKKNINNYTIERLSSEKTEVLPTAEKKRFSPH